MEIFARLGEWQFFSGRTGISAGVLIPPLETAPAKMPALPGFAPIFSCPSHGLSSQNPAHVRTMKKQPVGKTDKSVKPKDTATSRWLSYRPEIKVLDCTIRDGGLMNNHHFDDKIVKAVYTACVAAGIDYMELGYKA